jgi:hypothetical protein
MDHKHSLTLHAENLMRVADPYAKAISSQADVRFYMGDAVLEFASLREAITDAVRAAVEQTEDIMDCLWSYKTALTLTSAEEGGSIELSETHTVQADPPMRSSSGAGSSAKVDAEDDKFVI